MKHTIYPISIIGWCVLFVIQNTSSINLIIFELSLVKSTIIKLQLTYSLLDPIDKLSFIMMTILINNTSTYYNLFLIFLFFLLMTKLIRYPLITIRLLKRFDHTFTYSMMFLRQFDILNRFEDTITLRIEKTILNSLFQGTMFQFINIF